MSALQLRTLLEYVTNKSLHGVKFAYKGGRLYISYTDDGGNLFNRSFGTDGGYAEHEDMSITIYVAP
jgi:hypothetical protein